MSNYICVGDLVLSNEIEFANGDMLEQEIGIVIEIQDPRVAPPSALIMWQSGDIGKEWSDELEVISDSLSDEQLENVIGGMSYQVFGEWRASKINESR